VKNAKLSRQHVKLVKKLNYCRKLMEVADTQLSENPEPIEVDLYEMIIDDYYAAKQKLDAFENRMLRMFALERLNALKQ
jgi:hypothetical protein